MRTRSEVAGAVGGKRRKDVEAAVDAVREELRPLARGDEPVIAGPFVGEVGFELLYWLPFVRWAVEEVPGLAERLVLVSRGGTASWAGELGVRYVDLFELMAPEDVVRRRPSLKQRAVTEFDEAILTGVRDRLGLGRTSLLHPSLLYNLYYRVLKSDRRTFAAAVAHGDDGRADGFLARYRRLAPDAVPDLGLDLPDRYVAVRFYARSSLPDDAATRALLRALLENVAEKTPVVLLNNGMELDDHADLLDAFGDRIRSFSGLMVPERNLEVQTAIVARAEGFVGTYGGLSYLPPFLGVPSLSFHANFDGLQPWHLDLAQQLFSGPGWGPFATVRPDDLPLLDLVVGGLHDRNRLPGQTGESA